MTNESIRMVASDDCVIEVDGVKSHPHRGETVSLCGWFDMDALCLMYDFGELLGQIAASEEAEALRLIDTSDPLLNKFIDALTPLVRSWTWTDVAGKPLPQPYLNAAAFKALHIDELIYLSLLAVPRSPKEKKESEGWQHSPT